MGMPEDDKKDQPIENPYDFILNEPEKPKKSLVPKAQSKKQRTIFVIIAALGLLTLLIIAISLISGIGTRGITNMRELTKEQQEIIRVAEIGEKESNNLDLQSIATSTKLSVSSSQTDVITYLADQDIEIKSKDLSENADATTDARLEKARQNGIFDEEYASILVTLLNEYVNNLSRYFDQTDSEKQQLILQAAYQETQDILNNESLDQFSPSTE